MRTFAVGDIHGWADKLAALLPQLRAEASPGDGLVFIGDYIDRGPDSRGVVEQVLAERATWPGVVVALKGNHEAMMLAALATWREHDLAVRDWIETASGLATIASYTPHTSMEAFEAALPPEHRAFFDSLRLWHEDENGLYVHAGIPPRREPAECNEDDLIWIREPFIRSKYRWRKPVVFGHTPQYDESGGTPRTLEEIRWQPLNRPEKIGIDTGCAYGGPLTAVALPERKFYQAGGAARS